MYTKIFLSLLLLAVVENCHGRKLTRCELVNSLRKHDFADASMRKWVCIVEAESDRNTSLKSFGWGLFQLTDPDWCKPGVAGGACNAKCEDFLTDDIKKAAACASTAYKRHRFSVWPSFMKKCQNQLPDITNCN